MRNANKPKEMEKTVIEHILRPEYTMLILDRLVNRGDSINLVGEKGTGKSRLIKDLRRSVPEPAEHVEQVDSVDQVGHVHILYADLKNYRKTFPKLLEDFATQLKLAGPPAGGLGNLFAGIERRPGRFLVLLDNYDALLANPDLDPGFSETFFTDLNGLKNKDNVSLLCASCVAHHTRPVYIGGNTLTSPLTLNIDSLPPLTYKEIKNEILRRLDEYSRLDFQTHPEDGERMIETIHGQKFPYPRLKWFCAKHNGQSEEERMQPFKKKFKCWNKEFDKNSSSGLEKKLTKMSTKVASIGIASKLNKIIIYPFSKTYKLIDKLIDKIKS